MQGHAFGTSAALLGLTRIRDAGQYACGVEEDKSLAFETKLPASLFYFAKASKNPAMAGQAALKQYKSEVGEGSWNL